MTNVCMREHDRGRIVGTTRRLKWLGVYSWIHIIKVSGILSTRIWSPHSSGTSNYKTSSTTPSFADGNVEVEISLDLRYI